MKLEDPTFSVYLSQPIKNEFALAIITHQKYEDSFITEYFALVHSKEPRMFTMRYDQEGAKYLEQAFDYNLNSVRDDALSCAQADLDGYIISKYESTKDPYFLSRFFDLKKIPQAKLLSFHVQGFFAENFKNIADKSVCGPLREYFSAVFKVPPIRKANQK